MRGRGAEGEDEGTPSTGDDGLATGSSLPEARLHRPHLAFDPEADPELRARLEQAVETAAERAGDDEGLRRLWHFFLLYNDQEGVFGRRHGNPYAMRRRVWIEMMVSIENKRAEVVPFIFNQSQRNLEAIVVDQERRGQPVRVIILKVRQNGISTYILALILWLILTRQNVKARIVTDREELCETLLNRIRQMFKRLHKANGTPWKLDAAKSNRDMIVMGEPFNSSVHVVSANTPSPGFGETNICVDMEETSKWPKAEEKAKGIELALPEVPGSFAFEVSQPKGNTGHFATKFKRSWYRQEGLADPDANADNESDEELLGGGGWRAMFIPWFLHQEYRWTKLGSNSPILPSRVSKAVKKRIGPEEEILLKQRYLIRGKGWLTVDLDQLAWRRYYLTEKCNGNLQTFHEQCPATPQEAFLSSGRPAFNIEHVQRAVVDHKRPPLWQGNIIEGGELIEDTRNGPLRIYAYPDPERSYALGADTAAGVPGGDPCTIVVIDDETFEVVAEWYGWEQPHEFGPTVARVSDYYEAVAAIETHPSQHGLAVFMKAEEAGCTRLFVQEKWSSSKGGVEERKGWISSTKGKGVLYSAVQSALANRVPIPSQRLLQEMLDAQLNDKEDIARNCRNDLIVAFGISLKLAELARVERGQDPEPEPPPPTGSDEAFWAERHLRFAGADGRPPTRYDTMTGQGL